MMEFGVINNTTNEEEIIFGYNVMDALRRAKMNVTEWTVIYVEFID